ncbi:helix-turn-helix domain-containing protein [Streptomyces sp. NPDC051320]|uniref:helix-turn-helix domain-containing protein n=1 Tax=Streptomyces sp. NPDC051320 TaxID=3154644 RepID=UPI00342DA6A0
MHSNLPHTSRFTIIGNHLAQHFELSLIAIGLAVHIQSLPTGAKVGIKALAARFPEGETTIAAALRELENHHYLLRSRERLPSGRVVTRTVSYNQPHSAATDPAPTTACEAQPEAGRSASSPTASAPVPAPARVPTQCTAPAGSRAPEPDVGAAALVPVRGPEPTAPQPGPERTTPQLKGNGTTPLPQPELHDVERHRAAAGLLAGLRRHEPRMLLAEHDIRRLTPAVAAWLEHDTHPDALRHALTAGLPEPLNHPAALLAHRLTALLPPPLPATAPALAPEPFQDCEGCDRPFRAPQPGRCRDCRSDLAGAA